MKRLVILGAGGHGQTVADVARQCGCYDEILFLDDRAKEAAAKCSEYLKYMGPDTEMYPAFGNNESRLKWERTFVEAGIKLARIIHPTAYVSPTAIIENGWVVLPHAIVNTGVHVRMACIINCGAIVDHGCVLGEGVHVGPGAIVKAENDIPRCTKIESGEVIARSTYPV